MDNEKDIRKRINYSSWPTKKVTVSEIHLDPKNYRLPDQGDWDEEVIIDWLYQNVDLLTLINIISIEGFFPDEMPVVIYENNKCIVLEGNRRIAALKILTEKRFEKILNKISGKKAFKINENLRIINVVIAPDRLSAQNYLAYRHTIIPRKQWNPFSKANFYLAQLKLGKTIDELRFHYPGINIVKHLKLINMYDLALQIKYDSPSIEQKVKNITSFPASTFERVYNSKLFKGFLGFDFQNNGEVIIYIEKREFFKGFKQIITDIVSNVINSRVLGDKELISKYIDKMPNESIPNISKVKAEYKQYLNMSGKHCDNKDITPINLSLFKDDKTIADQSVQSMLSPVKRTNSNCLVPLNLSSDLESIYIDKCIYELQNLKYNKFPNAWHVLLRSFMECSLKVYLDKCNYPLLPKRHGGYIFFSDVLDAFQTKMKYDNNHSMKQVCERLKSKSKGSHSISEYFDSNIHNPKLHALPSEVVEAWEICYSLIEFILNKANIKPYVP